MKSRKLMKMVTTFIKKNTKIMFRSRWKITMRKTLKFWKFSSRELLSSLKKPIIYMNFKDKIQSYVVKKIQMIKMKTVHNILKNLKEANKSWI